MADLAKPAPPITSRSLIVTSSAVKCSFHVYYSTSTMTMLATAPNLMPAQAAIRAQKLYVRVLWFSGSSSLPCRMTIAADTAAPKNWPRAKSRQWRPQAAFPCPTGLTRLECTVLLHTGQFAFQRTIHNGLSLKSHTIHRFTYSLSLPPPTAL